MDYGWSERPKSKLFCLAARVFAAAIASSEQMTRSIAHPILSEIVAFRHNDAHVLHGTLQSQKRSHRVASDDSPINL